MKTIDEIRQPISEEFELFESAFRDALQTDNPILQSAMESILAHRGKQLRPMLVLLSARMCHGISEKAIQAAVALEMLHTASLIHDDVVDQSPLRRGIPTLNQRWGNKVAVLVGDFMLSKVISIVAKMRNVKMMQIVSDMGKSLAQGELLQLHSKQSMWIDEGQYMQIIGKKTAALFRACAQAGAATSGGTVKQETALSAYAEHLGLCFQIKDDILDYSDAEELGKPTMSDIRDGKATLPIIEAMRRATPSDMQTIRELADRLQVEKDEERRFEIENEIKSFVLRYDGIRYAERIMQEHKDMAMSALREFRDRRLVEPLEELLNYAIYRMY